MITAIGILGIACQVSMFIALVVTVSLARERWQQIDRDRARYQRWPLVRARAWVVGVTTWTLVVGLCYLVLGAVALHQWLLTPASTWYQR